MSGYIDDLMSDTVTDTSGVKITTNRLDLLDSAHAAGSTSVPTSTTSPTSTSPTSTTPTSTTPTTDVVGARTKPKYEERLTEIEEYYGDTGVAGASSPDVTWGEYQDEKYEDFKILENIISREHQYHPVGVYRDAPGPDMPGPIDIIDPLGISERTGPSPTETALHAGEGEDYRFFERLFNPFESKHEDWRAGQEGFPESSIKHHPSDRKGKKDLYMHETNDRELYLNYYNAGNKDDSYQVEGHENYTEMLDAKSSLQAALTDAGYDFNIPDLLHQTTPFGTKVTKQYAESQDAYFPRLKKWRMSRISDKNPRVRDAYDAYLKSLDGAQKYMNNVQTRFISDKNKYIRKKLEYGNESSTSGRWAKLEREKQDILYSLELLNNNNK